MDEITTHNREGAIKNSPTRDVSLVLAASIEATTFDFHVSHVRHSRKYTAYSLS